MLTAQKSFQRRLKKSLTIDERRVNELELMTLRFFLSNEIKYNFIIELKSIVLLMIIF
jgi:hypothetical protein